MSVKISRPLTEEQKRARQQKRDAREQEQLRLEQDLIIADLLGKIAQLEANQNDDN